jgi:BirA family transcriptional regulator, biotin operon repressor / biotin---[acetyl-CoA-carboxylase] ligase
LRYRKGYDDLPRKAEFRLIIQKKQVKARFMDDTLSENAILAALTTQWLGRPTYYLPQTESTNDLLREMSSGEPGRLPSGTMIIADYQRQGKGRLGRRWQAPPGTSLLFSLLFRLDWPAEQAAWLTMIGSLAAMQAIEEVTHLPTAIKWPNDLMIDEPEGWRKVGGVLLEGEFKNDRLLTAVLGVGINVNVPGAELPVAATPATSLQAASGQPVARLPLLAELLQRLETLADAAAAGETPQPRWQERLVTLGRRVQVSSAAPGQAESMLTGTAENTDAWGRLLVRDERGILHAVSAGDVTLRG